MIFVLLSRPHLRTTSMDDVHGSETMMPYDTYRLYQIERAPSPAEVRYADEQAACMASAVSSLFRGVTRLVRTTRRPSGVPAHGRPRPAQG
jgi:hypothetical protein